MPITVQIVKGSSNNIINVLNTKLARDFFPGNLRTMANLMAGSRILVDIKGLYEANGNKIPHSEILSKKLYKSGITSMDFSDLNIKDNELAAKALRTLLSTIWSDKKYLNPKPSGNDVLTIPLKTDTLLNFSKRYLQRVRHRIGSVLFSYTHNRDDLRIIMKNSIGLEIDFVEQAIPIPDRLKDHENIIDPTQLMPMTLKEFRRAEGGFQYIRHVAATWIFGIGVAITYGIIVNPKTMYYLFEKLADLDFSFEGETLYSSAVEALKDSKLWEGVVLAFGLGKIFMPLSFLIGNYNTPTDNSINSMYYSLESYLNSDDKKTDFDRITNILKHARKERTYRKYINRVGDDDTRHALEKELRIITKRTITGIFGKDDQTWKEFFDYPETDHPKIKKNYTAIAQNLLMKESSIDYSKINELISFMNEIIHKE